MEGVQSKAGYEKGTTGFKKFMKRHFFENPDLRNLKDRIYFNGEKTSLYSLALRFRECAVVKIETGGYKIFGKFHEISQMDKDLLPDLLNGDETIQFLYLGPMPDINSDIYKSIGETAMLHRQLAGNMAAGRIGDVNMDIGNIGIVLPQVLAILGYELTLSLIQGEIEKLQSLMLAFSLAISTANSAWRNCREIEQLFDQLASSPGASMNVGQKMLCGLLLEGKFGISMRFKMLQTALSRNQKHGFDEDDLPPGIVFILLLPLLVDSAKFVGANLSSHLKIPIALKTMTDKLGDIELCLREKQRFRSTQSYRAMKLAAFLAHLAFIPCHVKELMKLVSPLVEVKMPVQFQELPEKLAQILEAPHHLTVALPFCFSNGKSAREAVVGADASWNTLISSRRLSEWCGVGLELDPNTLIQVSFEIKTADQKKGSSNGTNSRPDVRLLDSEILPGLSANKISLDKSLRIVNQGGIISIYDEAGLIRAPNSGLVYFSLKNVTIIFGLVKPL